MTSCACRSIPVWGAPRCHSSGLEGLAANKQNGSCVPRGFRRYLSRCADTRWSSGHHDYSSQGYRCRANTHIHPHASLCLSLAHHTLFSLCAPQALFTLHRGSSLCGAVALPPTPSRHVSTLARRLWTSPRPLASLLFDGMLVLVSPVEATAICRLSGLDRGTQAGRWVVSTAVSLPRIPPPACLMSPPRLHRRLSFLLHALYFDSAPRPSCLGLDVRSLAHRVLI